MSKPQPLPRPPPPIPNAQVHPGQQMAGPQMAGPGTPRLSTPTMASFRLSEMDMAMQQTLTGPYNTVYRRTKSGKSMEGTDLNKPTPESNIKSTSVKSLPPPPPPPSKSRRKRCSPQAKKTCHEVRFVLKGFISISLFLAAAGWGIYKLVTMAVYARTPVSLADSGASCVRDPIGELISPNATNGITKPIHLGMLEPHVSSMPYFGFQMDWAVDTPEKLDLRMGRRSAVIGAWVQWNATGYEKNMLAWYPKAIADQAKKVGGVPSILLVTIRPTCTLDQIRQQDIEDLATQLADINHSLNVPVMLRWAHEMNGNWDTYGQKPLAYVSVWRRVHDAVRNKTTMTAMIWSPNGHNCGYPWSNGPMTVNRRDAELVAMDTNKDGVINMLDDPYSPYFPGADYVEWIGLSTYHYGWQPSQSPLTMGYNDATNVLPEPNRFLNIITGRNICPANQPIWSIYDIADKFDKPFGVPETAAVFYEDTINGPGPGELAIKQAWWKQILTPVVFRQLPRFKMVVWFEEDKWEIDRGQVSYSVTNHENIRKSFLADFPLLNVLWADQLSYQCNGTVNERVKP